MMVVPTKNIPNSVELYNLRGKFITCESYLKAVIKKG